MRDIGAQATRTPPLDVEVALDVGVDVGAAAPIARVSNAPADTPTGATPVASVITSGLA
jgi:hypothetical protein